jgi:hypothetical protein
MDPMSYDSPFGDYFGSPYSGAMGAPPLMPPGYESFAGYNAPRRFSGFEGSPLNYFGDFGQIAGMVLNPMLQQHFMGPQGYTAVGVGHGVNPWQVLRGRQFHENRMALLQSQTLRDGQAIGRVFQGIAALPGVDQTPANIASAARMGGALAGALPYLAGTPFEDAIDSLAGRRGSTTVMASRMAPSLLQRFDPVTGRMGTTAAGAQAFASSMANDLFASPHESYGGLSAGEMGGVFNEMSNRGLIRTGTAGSATRDVRSIIGGLDDKERSLLKQRTGIDYKAGQTLSAEDIEKAKIDPQIVDKLRQVDFTRNKEALKEMGKAMSAMKDIFGENGNPDAPIPTIMAGLEAMTGGQLRNRLGRGNLGQQIRETYNVAKLSGIGLGQMQSVMAEGFAKAQMFGVGNEYGAMAAHDSLAFMGAMRGNTIDGWNSKSAEQLAQSMTSRKVAFGKSQWGNNMGLLLRLGELGGFQQGSQAAQLLEDVKSGKVSAAQLATGRFRDVLIGAKDAQGHDLGIDGSNFSRMVLQSDQNVEALTRDGKAVQQSQRLQWEGEIKPFVTRVMERPIVDALVRGGMNRKQAMKMARDIAGNVLDRSKEIDQKDMADPAKRAKAYAKILQDEASKHGAGNLGNLDVTASSMFGDADRMVQRKFGGDPRNRLNMIDFLNMDNPEVQAQAQRIQAQGKIDARLQEKLAPLASGGLWARISSALQETDAKDPDSLKKILAKTFGIKNKDVTDKIASVLGKSGDLRKRLANGESLSSMSKEEQALAAEVDNLAPLLAQLKPEIDKMAEEDKKKGIKAGERSLGAASRLLAGGQYSKGAVGREEARRVLEKRGVKADDAAIDKELKEGRMKTFDEAEASMADKVDEKDAKQGAAADAQKAAEKGDGHTSATPSKMTLDGTLTIVGTQQATLKATGLS